MENVNKFGERLLKLREERNETQQQLADAIGITRQSLSRYETNERTPNIDLIYNVSKHYNVSADYLLGLADVQSLDNDIKTACKVTGLSEEAIKAIKNIHDNDPYRILKRDIMYSSEILEKILLSDKFMGFLSRIGRLKGFESTLPDDQLTLKCTAPDSNGLQLDLTKKDLIEYDLQLGFDEFKNIIEEIIKEDSNNAEHNPPKE